MFYDCFDKPLDRGDDIIIAYVDTFSPYLLCGIVENITNEYMDYSVQHWEDEIEVITHHRIYANSTYDGKLKNIYKIR